LRVLPHKLRLVAGVEPDEDIPALLVDGLMPRPERTLQGALAPMDHRSFENPEHPQGFVPTTPSFSIRTVTAASAELASAGLITIDRHFDGQRKQYDGIEYGPFLVRRIREFSLTINFDN
jgi:hypothetical protein